MKFLAAFVIGLFLSMAATASAVAPYPPHWFLAKNGGCVLNFPKIYYQVPPSVIGGAPVRGDASTKIPNPDVVEHRIYRNGGLHRTIPLQYEGWGVQHSSWYPVATEFWGTTQTFYATAVNNLGEESVPSEIQVVDIGTCGGPPTFIDNFNATVLGCDEVMLTWTPLSSAYVPLYRISRVPEEEEDLLCTDSKRQRIGFHFTGPLPLYVDPPMDYPDNRWYWGDEYFPMEPGKTYCYALEGWMPSIFSLTEKSETSCVTLPFCQ